MSNLTDDAIHGHYEEARPVYEELARLGGYETITAPDFTGWYIRDDHTDHDAIEDGFSRKARVTGLGRDLNTALEKLDRVFYAITSYKPDRIFDEWAYCSTGDGGTEFRDETPMPGYADIAAFPAWGDIDLDDALKPKRGTLDDSTKETVEAALEAYIDAYADLYGSRDAVYALDSVGGAYVFGAPEATVPIFDYYSDDSDARGRVFDALRDRMNDWLADRQAEIEEEVDGAADVIDPDWVNNCNRQYKAPLSLHKDHDAVVTPIDVEDPSYDLTPFDAIDDTLREACKQWAAELTNTDHRGRVDRLVKKLWPKWSEGADSWQTALDSWIEHQRAKEKARQRDRGKSQSGNVYSAEDASITTSHADVEQAIDNLDIFEVADRTIVHQWTENKSGVKDNSGAGKKAFVPIWRDADTTGTANYVDEKGVWVDSGEKDHYGTAVEMGLIANENWPRDERASGEDWARGVQYLRGLGFDIPVYIPEAGDPAPDGGECEKMPFWAVKRAAVALGVLPEEAFVERENDDGDTYEGFPGRDTYTNALEAIEDAGFEHGRKTPEQEAAKDTIEEFIERVGALEEDVGDAFTGGDWSRLYAAVENLHQEDMGLIDGLADTADGIHRHSLKRHHELAGHVEDFNDVYREDNKLKRIDTEGTRYRAKPLLDFAIEVDSFLRLEDGSYMANVEIIPASEPDVRFEKQVSPKVFNRPQRFKDEILAERFSTTIEAEDIPEEDVLDYVRKYIHAQEAPDLKGTNQMGLKDGQFVTPNGVITADGWEHNADAVYVERDIGAERKFSLSKSNTPEFDESEVATILELLTNTRHHERFIPVLGWFYAAPFRPKIVDRAGDFNILAVEGRSGTGKSTTVGTLWKALGMCKNEALPFSCNDTTFSLITTLASSRGVPMWLDEYKPSDFSDYQSKRLHDLLRKAATGGTEQRGNADKTTEEYHLRAPVCLTGEEGVIGNAEQRRSIQTRFRNEPTEPESEESRRFKRLVGDAYVEDGTVQFDEDGGYDLFQHAMAYYQYASDFNEREFVSDWREAKKRVEQRLQEWDASGLLDDLEKQGLQTVVFGFWRLRDFAEQMGADMSCIPDEGALDDALRYVADINGTGRESHLDRYVQLISNAAVNGELERDTHFTVVKANEPGEELRINVSKAHDKITKYARDHDITEDLLAQAKDYRSRFKEEYESESEGYAVNYSQPSPPIDRAVGIDMRAAQEELEGFDRSVFVQQHQDVTPLADLSQGEIVSVTVECVQTYNDPAFVSHKGWIKDSTDHCQMILRDPNGDYMLEEDTAYRLDDVRVLVEDGIYQVEIIPNITEISWIEPGEGHTDEDGHDWLGEEPEGGSADPIGELSDGDEGLAVEARVESVDTKTPEEIDGKVELRDETGSITATVWADAGQPVLEKGECYHLKDVSVSTFQGDLEVQVDADTVVEEIAVGLGNAPMEDPGDSATLDEVAATNSGGGASNGTLELARAAAEWVRNQPSPQSREEIVVHLVETEDVDAEMAKEATERAINRDGFLAAAPDADGWTA